MKRGRPGDDPRATRARWRSPLAAGLAIVALFVLVYPVIYVLIGSLRPGGGVLSQSGTFTFENYLKIFRSGFSRFILNSLIICAAATLASTALSIMAAYAFSRFNFRLKRTLFTGILCGQVFPWIVLINPLFVAFARCISSTAMSG